MLSGSSAFGKAVSASLGWTRGGECIFVAARRDISEFLARLSGTGFLPRATLMEVEGTAMMTGFGSEGQTGGCLRLRRLFLSWLPVKRD